MENITTHEIKPRSFIKSFLLALAFLLFFVIIGGIIIKQKPPPPPSVASEEVFSAQAITADVTAHRPSVLLVGEVQARDEALLTAPIETEVVKIIVREGDSFKRRQSLVNLDLREQQLQAQSQQALFKTTQLRIKALLRNQISDQKRLVESRQLLALAERDYQRNIDLQNKNLVTQGQVEKTEQTLLQQRANMLLLQNQVADYVTQKEVLEQELVQKQTALEQTKLLIERSRIRAPFVGRVSKVHTSVGARVARGAALIEIYNPQNARLRALIPNRHAPSLTSDIESLLSVAPDKLLTLSVVRVSPRIEEKQGSVEVFFDLPPGDWILGATYEFQLQLPLLENTLALPFDSVYDGDKIYFIDKERRARGMACKRVGVARKQEQPARALLRCAGVVSGMPIIATQLPNLIEGAKVRVISSQ